MVSYGNMVGGKAPLKTVILVDDNGNEVVGVVTDSEVIFTAIDSDVRKGKVYASDDGMSVGTLEMGEEFATKQYVHDVLASINVNIDVVYATDEEIIAMMLAEGIEQYANDSGDVND